MNIALIADDDKKKLIENLCIKYRYILIKHKIFATSTTGRLIEDSSNIHICKYPPGKLGGEEQVISQIANKNVDMIIFLKSPESYLKNNYNNIHNMTKLCLLYNIPFATNIITAELLLLAIENNFLNYK